MVSSRAAAAQGCGCAAGLQPLGPDRCRYASPASATHVFDETGELVAHGTSTLMALPGKGLDLGIDKFLP